MKRTLRWMGELSTGLVWKQEKTCRAASSSERAICTGYLLILPHQNLTILGAISCQSDTIIIYSNDLKCRFASRRNNSGSLVSDFWWNSGLTVNFHTTSYLTYLHPKNKKRKKGELALCIPWAKQGKERGRKGHFNMSRFSLLPCKYVLYPCA